MNATDRETFIRRLNRSRLASPKQIDRVIGTLPSTSEAKVLAQRFVQAGVLTRFQVRMLLSGRVSGFHLGPYQIQEEIGRGGMGRVYKAIHRNMKRVVALKVLNAEMTESPSAVKAFQREIEAASSLKHPNIVHAYDAGEKSGRLYLVMEYVDGYDLAKLVKTNGPMPVALACEILRQAALGLQHAHEHGLVHRDIKPGNLIVDKSASDSSLTVKILDFGLARLVQENIPPADRDTLATSQNKILGTPDYMSPEQARDVSKADIRSDLYGLGCTMYFLLTGEAPFEGGGVVEKILRHNNEMPRALETMRGDLPVEVAAIVRKLMAKHPEDRFQTPNQLADALAPFAKPAPLKWEASLDASEGTWSSEDLRDTKKSGASIWKNLRDTQPDRPALTLPSGEIMNAFLSNPKIVRQVPLWVWWTICTSALSGALLMGIGLVAWKWFAG